MLVVVKFLSGVKLAEFNKKKLPTVNYEISLEGRRVEGDDFFCCLTFPYNKTHATFVLGGWGGSFVAFQVLILWMPWKTQP